jgi:hypothetical protein
MATSAIAFMPLTACHREQSGAREQKQEISAQAAKELAVARYRALFSDKFLRNPVDGKYLPFPALLVGDMSQIERQDEVWLLRVSPLFGLSLEARVDVHGRWVEFVRFFSRRSSVRELIGSTSYSGDLGRL